MGFDVLKSIDSTIELLPFIGYEPPEHIVISKRLKPKTEPKYDKEEQKLIMKVIMAKASKKSGEFIANMNRTQKSKNLTL